MTQITAWTVLCRRKDYAGVKVVVLGAELITKSFLQLFSLGLSSVLESLVKAAFIVFLSLPCSLK